MQLLVQALPPHVTLTCVDPIFGMPSERGGGLERTYDLVILGNGGSFGTEVLGNVLQRTPLARNLCSILARSPHRIGLFGTEFRDELDPEFVGQVLDHLTVWFARTTRDVETWGRGRRNVLHFGDWQVIATRPAGGVPEARVFSRSLDELLSRLDEARSIAWREYVSPRGTPRGTIPSVLADIFSRDVGEGCWFPVDHRALEAYRLRMQRLSDGFRDTLATLLRVGKG